MSARCRSGATRSASSARSVRRALLAVCALVAATTACGSGASDDTWGPASSAAPGAGDGGDGHGDAMIDDVTDAGDRVRALALEAAHRTLDALALDVDAVDGASRSTACTDGIGGTTDEWYGEYSSGGALGPATLDDDALDRLPAMLGVELLEDSDDADGRRMIAFGLHVDDVEVIVRVSRVGDGSATLTTTTPCID